MSHGTQAESLPRIARPFLVTIGAAHELAETFIRAAAQHTGIVARNDTFVDRIKVRRFRSEIESRLVHVAAPFEHVSVHVVETKLVGQFFTHVMRSAFGVVNIPTYLVGRRIDIETSCCSSSASI